MTLKYQFNASANVQVCIANKLSSHILHVIYINKDLALLASIYCMVQHPFE